MVDTRLTDWVINKIKTEYPNDVALLVAVDGESVNGDGYGESFDYFVPDTERGNELAQTFIIGGVGYDLYPRSWERTERTASLDDITTPCLGNARILYARSPEDVERFECIRQKLLQNLTDPVFKYKKALENLDIAMDVFRTLMFEERLYKVRALAGFILHYLSISVACLNGTYRKEWYIGALDEISKWTQAPQGFAEYYKAVLNASTIGELRSISQLLIASVREFISLRKTEAAQPEKKPDYIRLAGWYHELRITWNRLYYYCGINNADGAFVDACYLQSELDIVGEEFCIGEMDLLGCFDANNLEPLLDCAMALEKSIITIIEGHNIKIRSYETLDDFLEEAK